MKVNAVQSYATNTVKKSTQKFSNNDARKLLKEELLPSMPENKINLYIEKVNKVCEKLKIQFNQLPINKEHPGNLSPDKNHEFCQEVLKLSLLG